MFKKWRSTQIVQIKYIWEIGVVPILQCNCYYTLIFINFVILLLLFTSLRDFNPIQRDFFPCFDRWQEITKCICLKKMKVNPNSSDKIHLRNWCFTPNLSIIVITPSFSLTLWFYPCSSQVCAISPLFNTILPLLWRLTKNKIALSATKSRWLVNSMDKTRS